MAMKPAAPALDAGNFPSAGLLIGLIPGEGNIGTLSGGAQAIGFAIPTAAARRVMANYPPARRPQKTIAS